MPRPAPPALALLLLATLLPAAQQPLREHFGDSAADKFGAAAGGAGDVDGDGFGDYVAGAPEDDDNGNASGSVRAFSGRTGAVLFTIHGTAANQRFGISVRGAGDVDRDGRDDIIVGTDAGFARILSGNGGATLRTLSDPALPRLGRSVRAAGDVDADGWDDVLVGAPNNGGGAVRVYSGKDGAVLHTFAADGNENTFASAGDVDRDGHADVILGDALYTGLLLFQGRVQIRSGATGAVLHTIDGAQALDQLGSTVGPAGDIDNDGFADVIAVSLTVGVQVFSGQTGALLRTFVGERAGDSFGFSALGIGDVDGDGRSDLLIGAPSQFVFGTYAKLYSGASGALLRTFRGKAPLDGFGTAVGGADIDGDGFVEPLVGAPDHADQGVMKGCVAVYDVATLRGFETARTINGGPGDQLGSAVASAGDVDKDGKGDFVVGVPLDDTNGADAGRVLVVSGATGAVLFTFLGDSAGDRLGTSVGGGGDVNNDGFPDIVAGAPFDDNTAADAGSVRVYSGANGAILWTFDGAAAGDQLGSSVAVVGDIDRDGWRDIAAGAPLADSSGVDAGRVRIWSGRTGAVLWTWNGDGAGDQLGTSVDAAGDVNNDGWADVIAGAPSDDNTGADAGSARVWSGRTGAVLYTFDGDSAGDRFGSAVASAGDVDRDGRGDLLVGAPLGDDGGADAGRARVLRGIDGTVLFNLDGAAAGARFGTAVAGIGDANGDGVPDLAIGARPIGAVAGSVRVVSGANASPLATLTATAAGTGFGAAVAGVADTNGDGFVEIAVGAPEDPAGGATAGAATLHASTVRIDPGIFVRYGPACQTSAGKLPRIGISGRPLIGGSFAMTLYAGPPSAPAALHFDVTRQNLDLGLIGFSGCVMLAAPFLAIPGATTAAGTATKTLNVPARSSMIGVALHGQWVTAEILQGRLPVSNGGTVTFGTP
jgi:hypothetical protein